VKCGILSLQSHGLVFASPLAKRYFALFFYPNRSPFKKFTKLFDLVKEVIRGMFATTLRNSVVNKSDFPKEATFQHLFMSGLSCHTTLDCLICLELSKIFPQLEEMGGKRSSGEIDFYLNGELRWGIELLVQGNGIGEHISRFSTKGKYSSLIPLDYITVDFREKAEGTISRVEKHEKWLSVFFAEGSDFSTCECLYGLEEKSFNISLEN
jgi:hypothetical protein